MGRIVSEANSKVYCIRSHCDAFYAGVQEDGTQVLLVTLGETTLARILFDAGGVLVLAEECEGEFSKGELDFQSGEGKPAMPRVVPGQIRVAKFSVPRYGVDICPRPLAFENFLANPEGVEPEERWREQTYRQVREWDALGRFVLNTPGNEYWMDGDGSVLAT